MSRASCRHGAQLFHLQLCAIPHADSNQTKGSSYASTAIPEDQSGHDIISSFSKPHAGRAAQQPLFAVRNSRSGRCTPVQSGNTGPNRLQNNSIEARNLQFLQIPIRQSHVSATPLFEKIEAPILCIERRGEYSLFDFLDIRNSIIFDPDGPISQNLRAITHL
ncbi:hypothetical protein BKA58DRAFT_19783 [Alternaria rosae]|uniref:uncharacterized protein n=1 Tax=Alternaria rosae TaxID=1187941 RepID=UPI001E8ECAAA|nr:uncharacterized protein BKA58DRAFT_19783 [Alternaria rosae]KAH6882459.1 hypothetical protein BKA58DRAFT_19783 [Alternaria rosae]